MAVVGVRINGHTLEEASSVLAQGDEVLGVIVLGELQNLGLGERRHGKTGALGRSQEGVHDLRVLFIKNRAGGIDKFTAGSHARGCFLEHRQLQLGQFSRNVVLGQTPRYLGVTAHGAGARARRIDKHRVEQGRLAKHGIKRREHLIELAGIARDRTDARDTRLMKAREILIALAIVQIERGVLTIIPGALGLAHHHIGLGAATGADLQATTGTCCGSSDKLSIEVRGNRGGTLKHARCNRDLRIDRSMAAREDRRNELRDIRVGLSRKRILVQCKRSRRQIAGKVEHALGRIERGHNTSAQPARKTHQTRKANQTALGLIHVGCRGKVLNVVRNLVQHRVSQARGRLSTPTHQLNTLTHGNAARRMQVEHLEGRNTKRHANTRRDFFGLIQKLIE